MAIAKWLAQHRRVRVKIRDWPRLLSAEYKGQIQTGRFRNK